MDIKVNFSGRSHAFIPEEIAAVVDVMRQADPLTQGRYMREYEAKFAAFLGVDRCFATSNATCALEMIAQLLRFKQGDEFVTPAHTFTSSVYPLVKKGGTPVWADIDPVTRVVTPESVARCITSRTRAIVVVHLYGFVADMPGIMAVARERGIPVIEDAAQSIGCLLNGRRSGTFGDYAFFSLHSHKNITTGEGGVLYVRDPRQAALIPGLRHNGHRDYPGPREDYWIPAMSDLDFPEIDGERLWPNNYCLGEIECALGTRLLDRVDEINRQKRERALRFIDALADFPEIVFHRVADERHNYHLLVADLQGGRRDPFIRAISGEHGVKCIVQYYPLYRYPLYQRLGFGEADCPNTDRFFDGMVSFPFQHWLTGDEERHMLDATKVILRRLRNA